MMMTSRFVERVLNSPRARCQSAEQVRILLRQHYKSMKRYVLFSQGSVRTLVRLGGHFFIHE